MSSAWLLPEHVADVLPSQARHIEELRRALLDVARSYGLPVSAAAQAKTNGIGNPMPATPSII